MTLPNVVIEFNLSNQTMTPLTEAEIMALTDFSTSSDAAIAREVISNIVAQSENLAPQSLFGMVVLGMILGDENNEARNGIPAFPKHPGNKESLSQLVKTELAHAFESSPRRAELLRECERKAAAKARVKGKGLHARKAAPRGPCHGCCGYGCLGCTGVYTPACYAHDQCVSQYGYWDPRCRALLAAAIYSYYLVLT